MGRVIPFRPVRPAAHDDWPTYAATAVSVPQQTLRHGAPAGNPYAPPAAPRRDAGGVHRDAHPQRRGVVIGVAVVAALVVCAALVLHAHPRGHSSTRPAAVHSATLPSSAGRAPLSWTIRQGERFPHSPVAGPVRQDGPVASGFSQDDLGAAIAAAWIVYQASPEPGPAVYRRALAEQVTGPATQALTDTVTAGYAQAIEQSHLADGAPLGTGTTTFTGHHVTATTSGGRHVTVDERAPDANGVDQVYTLDVDLTWAGGDWKVVAPTSGEWSSAFAQLPAAPAGVTPFLPAAPSPAGRL